MYEGQPVNLTYDLSNPDGSVTKVNNDYESFESLIRKLEYSNQQLEYYKTQSKLTADQLASLQTQNQIISRENDKLLKLIRQNQAQDDL